VRAVLQGVAKSRRQVSRQIAFFQKETHIQSFAKNGKASKELPPHVKKKKKKRRTEVG
jgi:tRNA A37 N6-isopentenylltransferase MiaA